MSPAAEALLRELERQDAEAPGSYIGETLDGLTCLDGWFDLEKAAQAVLRSAQKDPLKSGGT